MKIIVPTYILTPQTLLQNKAIAFEEKIIAVDTPEALRSLYPEAEYIVLEKNSLIMPGLINAHVHLEFSANTTQLSYGDFIPWLYSVIDNREELLSGCDAQCMQKAVDTMLQNGTTTFGAISSHGLDLDVCAQAKQNVIFFNELIGSQAAMADALFGDFLARLDASKEVDRKGFYSAVAVHSPYSVHPILIKKALEIAKNEHLIVSAHFMESAAEREWLDKSEGDFKEFFSTLLKQDSALCSAKEFLHHFDGYPTLFTHGSYIKDEELEILQKHRHTLIHCPISNRLLGNKTLNIKKLNEKNINWIVATDGLSSNYGLDMFEEMKISLFMHSDAPLHHFAKALLLGSTKNAAAALGLKTGEICSGYNADMLVLDLDFTPEADTLYTHLLLHKYNISKVFIQGQLHKGKI